MNKFVTSALVLVAVASASAQNGKAMLGDFAKKFYDAKSLTVSYTAQRIGGLPREYTVVLSKPDKARIDTPTGFSVADGALISVYNSLNKTYSQMRETPNGLANLFQANEVHLWKVFFDRATFARVPQASITGNVKRKGLELTRVETTLDMSGDHFENFFFDANDVPRQAEYILKARSITTLLDTESVELGNDMLDSSHFVFVPPAGSHRG